MLILDFKNEEEGKELLRGYLKGQTEEYINKQINFLFETEGGFLDRFNYLNNFLNEEMKDSLLVSGSAVGSELLQAINFGFKKVVGTEVEKVYIDISNRRLDGYKQVESLLYGGEYLSFENEVFFVIMSSHIIEHTKDPEGYLIEHFRCLKKGGLMYLEFPDRNYFKELHTNTISFERFPIRIRNYLLFLMSKNNFIKKDKRSRYLLVRDTLKPIGIRDIKSWLSSKKIKHEIIGEQRPAAGIVRLIIKKLF